MTVALAYHDVVAAAEIDSTGFPGPLAARYKLTPEAFEAHLDAVAGAGVEIGLTLPRDSAQTVLLTFDDGGNRAPATAELLERRGWRGHFFAVSGLIGTPGFASADELVELARRGHVIGSHSHSHPTYMGRLDGPTLDLEWRRSRERLGEILGAAPDSAAVPGGYVSERVVASAARAGYRLLMTSDPDDRVRHHGDLAVLGRFPIWATTPAATAAAYARRDRWARTRIRAEWKAKQLAKAPSPALYDRLRRLRARLGRTG